MKRLNYLLLGLFVATAMFFTSCDDSEVVGPEITFKAGTGLITEDATVSIGETVGFSWEAVKGDAKLVSFTIRINNEDVDGFPNEDIDNEEYQDTWDTSFSAAGTYPITFIVEDKDGETSSETITITVEEAGTTLTVHSVVLLGAQSSTTGSCASLETGTVYTISGSNASSNSASIDIVHYNGAKDVALYSPSNSDIQGVSAYDISSWSTKNATKMSLTSLTSDDFDDITTSTDLSTLDTPSDDVVGSLAVDDVVVFETASGAEGVFMVTALTDAADGSVTIKVKINI